MLKVLISVFLVSALGSSSANDANDAAADHLISLAIVTFENETNDKQSSHWRHGIRSWLSGELGQAPGIRVLDRSVIEHALRELGLREESIEDPTQARRLGGIVGANRIVVGWYTSAMGKWRVRAQLINVASESVSRELTISGSDWLEICDGLTDDILGELSIKPSAVELERIHR